MGSKVNIYCNIIKPRSDTELKGVTLLKLIDTPCQSERSVDPCNFFINSIYPCG